MGYFNVRGRARQLITSHNRAAGLLAMCAIAMFLCAGIAQGQPVPDTILLPDSLGPLRPGYHLAFGSSTDNIYVASESSDIIVVDGNTFQRIKRINTGTPVGGVLLVSQHNRLYCSYPLQGRIGVIDCATNNVVDSIQVGTRPTLLCYSSGSDKLYCGDTIDRTVTVIDCATNEVRKVIPVGDSLTAMAHDPTTNKVYAATRDAVRAISCSADSIVANIDEIKSARGFCVNKRRQKLYVVGRENNYPDTIHVVSTQSDSVIAEMHFGWTLQPSIACNEVTDRLYAVGHDFYMEVFDCSLDTFIRGMDIWPYTRLHTIVCDSVHNRVYCLCESWSLLELDGTTLDFASATPIETDPRNDHPFVLESDPARHRLVCVCGSYDMTSELAVFDHKSDSTYVRGAYPLRGWERVMCHNPATGRLYCRWGSSAGGVCVVDEQTNRVVGQTFLSKAAGERDMVYSRTSNKFYFWVRNGPYGDQSCLGVLDGSNDSLLKLIEIGDMRHDAFPCWCPGENKVYCFGSWGPRYYVTVVDCNADSVVRTIEVPDLVRGFEYLDNGRVLCDYSAGLALIDCQTDSIVVDSAMWSWRAIAHTGDGGKFYSVRGRRIEVRSSNSLALLKAIDWPYYDGLSMEPDLAYSDSTRKLYWMLDGGDSLLAIDCTSDTVTARMAASVSYGLKCFDHSGRYLFSTDLRADTCLRVFDTQTDSLVAVYDDLPTWPTPVIANPEQHRIYVGCQDVILVYPDAPSGIHEVPNAEVRATKLGPTVVNGVLCLPGDRGPGTEDRAALLDVAGRVVMKLQPGANNISRLGPGVYFVRGPKTEDGRPGTAVSKVVVTK